MARLPVTTGLELLELARPRMHRAGEILMSQGAPGDQVCLLRAPRPDGAACVKVTATLENGSETLLAIRVSGDLVGELAGLLTSRRSSTVTTCTDVVVHRFSRNQFLSFLGRRPEAWLALAQMMASRLEWSNRRRLEFAGYDVPVRLARVLVDLCEQYGVPVPRGFEINVTLTQPEFGNLIGARPDAVGKAMRQLGRLGLIDVGYRRTIVREHTELRKFADLV